MGVRVLAPIGVLAPLVVVVLLVLVLSLEPASLVPTLGSIVPSRAEDVLHYLLRLNALNRFFFRGFIGVGCGGSQDVFNHAARETFYKEFNGLWVGEIIARHSCKAFEVVGILIDIGPLQPKGLQLCSSPLLALGVLILIREFCQELVPYCWDVVNRLEGV